MRLESNTSRVLKHCFMLSSFNTSLLALKCVVPQIHMDTDRFRSKLYTVERLTDNDNFECADPGLVKKGPSALSKHKTPVGKLIRRQKIDYMTYLYDCESPKLEFLRYHLSFYLRRKFLLCRLQKSKYCVNCSNR